MRCYIDSSAIIKLIKFERESKDLVTALPERILSSNLARIEVLRAITVFSSDLLGAAYAVLAEIEMLAIDNAILARAENFPPFITLRTLDSIHLASALTIKNEIGGIITYDKEMMKAATKLGFKVLSPGMK